MRVSVCLAIIKFNRIRDHYNHNRFKLCAKSLLPLKAIVTKWIFGADLRTMKSLYNDSKKILIFPERGKLLRREHDSLLETQIEIF